MTETAVRPTLGEPRRELLQAAELVEATAYDIATSRPSSIVSELIVIAAELDRLAKQIGTDA